MLQSVNSSNRLLPENYMPLSMALAMLPSLKPKVAADWLNVCYADAVMPVVSNGKSVKILDPLVSLDMGGINVPTDVLAGLCELGLSNWSKKISPGAAAVLLHLYVDKAFPDYVLKNKTIKMPLQQLLDYSAGEGEFVRNAIQHQDKLEEIQQRRCYLIAHPEGISETEFTPQLLDDVFWAHHGACSIHGQSMLIGGINVHKFIKRFASNTGKTLDFDVFLQWTGSDGQVRRAQVSFSRHSGNRRNDAERNWGLPE